MCILGSMVDEPIARRETQGADKLPDPVVDIFLVVLVAIVAKAKGRGRAISI